MYHGGKIRSRAAVQPSRDIHAAHPVHLTLNASVNSPSGERQMRYIIPDRLTRDQATTFRPSDLPIGQSSRKSSAHSDALSNHNFLTGPVKNIAGFGPPVGTQFLSMGETKLGANGPRRSVVSSPKNYANEDSTYVNGYTTNSKLPPQKNFSPSEKILFAESSSSPGVPIAYRSAEEKASNPDRLNLDRRNLTVCPILEGEDLLRLLNFQHNLITRIQNLSNLKRLIFLDLYDNKIEDMSGLSTLRSLRVLMLGKNRIEKISGLENLIKLDVLDLHGNQIRVVENLNQLCELRVLNLAGNQLECVSNLSGMITLAELNLRRNNIATVNQIDLLPSLLRLFLSFNDIERWSDVECLGESTSLVEITLDGNPITSEISYKQTVIKNISQLRQLDMKRITEEERRVAALMLKKEEDRRREVHRQTLAKEKKRLAISNAAMRWKAEFPFNKVDTSIKPEHKQTDLTEENTEQSSDKTKTQEKKYTEEGGGSWLSTVATWATSQYKNNLPLNAISLTSLDVAQSFLAEIENDNLFLFGPKSLESLDKNWGNQISASVNTITVQFIYFDDVSSCFEKIRQRFPNITSLVLKECGMSSFRQLNTIAQMRKLTSLTIAEGAANPLTQFTLWKSYALYRLSHLPLTTLNGNKISESDVLKSEQIFGCLSLATTSKLSQYRLSALCNNASSKPPHITTQPLVSGTKEGGKKKTAAAAPSKDNVTDTSLPAEAVGKSALQYTPSKQAQADNLDRQIRHSVSRELVGEICSNVCDIGSKQTHFFHSWPRIFIELVAEAVLEMKDTEAYIRREANEFYSRESSHESP